MMNLNYLFIFVLLPILGERSEDLFRVFFAKIGIPFQKNPQELLILIRKVILQYMVTHLQVFELGDFLLVLKHVLSLAI